MNDNDRKTDESDPAAEAFSRLEGEMALVRRAVEHLAAERADITIPDYSATLGEMSQHIAATHQTLRFIAEKPAMTLTPDNLARRIDHAAQQARQTDHVELRGAHDRYDRTSRELRGLIATGRLAHEQRRHLQWAAGGGLLAGCLLWAILPGATARSLPASWHIPEKMAVRTVGEPSMWQAGMRLMHADSSEAWEAVVQAAEMQRANLEVIQDCQQAAVEAKEPVRCTIRIAAVS